MMSGARKPSRAETPGDSSSAFSSTAAAAWPPSSIPASLINDTLRVRNGPFAIDFLQTLAEVRPPRPVGRSGDVFMLQGMKQLSEHGALLGWQRHHLLYEFGCAHG